MAEVKQVALKDNAERDPVLVLVVYPIISK